MIFCAKFQKISSRGFFAILLQTFVGKRKNQWFFSENSHRNSQSLEKNCKSALEKNSVAIFLKIFYNLVYEESLQNNKLKLIMITSQVISQLTSSHFLNNIKPAENAYLPCCNMVQLQEGISP